MEKSGSISGVVVRDLEWKDGRLVALQENDHILRRFGQVDVVKLAEGTTLETHRKNGADEIWVILEGEAEVHLTDTRHESPTLDQSMQIRLKKSSPQAVLIPFGVLTHITGQGDSTLLRITTHADELFPDDIVFSIGDEG